MKIYIVENWNYDYQCSSGENIKAFTDKTAAELFKLDLEEKAKIFIQKITEFKAVSTVILEPYWVLIRKKAATEEQLAEYNKLYQERFRLEQELIERCRAEEFHFDFYEDDDQEFLISELELEYADNG